MKKKFGIITIIMVFVIGFMIGVFTNSVKAVKSPNPVPAVNNVQRYSVDVQSVYYNGRTYVVFTSSAPSMCVRP